MESRIISFVFRLVFYLRYNKLFGIHINLVSQIHYIVLLGARFTERQALKLLHQKNSHRDRKGLLQGLCRIDKIMILTTKREVAWERQELQPLLLQPSPFPNVFLEHSLPQAFFTSNILLHKHFPPWIFSSSISYLWTFFTQNIFLLQHHDCE